MGNPHKLRTRDYLQVVAGAGFPILFIFATPTLVAKSIGLGIGILVFVIFLAALALAGVFKKQHKGAIAKHLFTGFIVSLGVSMVFLFFWTGLALGYIFSMNFFVTEGLIATCLGGFVGSLADARRR